MSELALELVLRQREVGRSDQYYNAVAPKSPQSGAPSGLRNSGCFFTDATILRALADRLSECVQQEAGVSQALLSFFASGRKFRRPSAKSFVCSCCGSSIRTHFDPNMNLLRRHQVEPKHRHQESRQPLRCLHANLGHPTDDLMRCFDAGGTRVAQRAVKCLRCSTCERMSRPLSHRPSRIRTDGERFIKRLFVDLCDVVDVRGNRYW